MVRLAEHLAFGGKKGRAHRWRFPPLVATSGGRYRYPSIRSVQPYLSGTSPHWMLVSPL